MGLNIPVQHFGSRAALSALLGRSVLGFALGALALLGSVQAAAPTATNIVYCQSSSTAFMNNPPAQRFQTFGGTPTSCDVETTAQLASAKASSGPGAVSGFGRAAGEPPCTNCASGPSNDAQAQASLNDDVVLNAPPGLGQGFAHITFHLDGTQMGTSASGTNNPFANTSLVGGLITSLVGSYQTCTINETTSGSFADACVSTAPIDYAQSPKFTISTTLALHAAVTNPQMGALADFRAGIRKIDFFDNTGKLISGITLTAASGAAYTVGHTRFNDFAGNGRSGALLYDPANGQSYTALSNADGTYQYIANLFTPHFDTLRAGDFDDDGVADLILYNSQNAAAYIGFGKGDGTFNFKSLFWSPGYNIVETGDVNGDGKSDVVLYDGPTGTLYTGISNGDGTFTYTYHLVSQNYTFVRLTDFTGDGKADLLLYRTSDGLASLGVGDGTGAFIFHPLFISPGYNMADIGDLNGDGKTDIILYNGVNGNAATGMSDGVGGFTFTPLLFSPGFTSVRLADHTGDGKADVTLYNANNAAAYFGTGTGTGTFNFQSLFWSPGYDYVIPEDVNGDGKVDVILYDSATGTQYTGISNGDGTFAYTYWYWGIGKVLAR